MISQTDHHFARGENPPPRATSFVSWLARDLTFGNLMLIAGGLFALSTLVYQIGQTRAALEFGIVGERVLRAEQAASLDARITSVQADLRDIRLLLMQRPAMKN